MPVWRSRDVYDIDIVSSNKLTKIMVASHIRFTLFGCLCLALLQMLGIDITESQ